MSERDRGEEFELKCTNCFRPWKEGAQYCYHCGQRKVGSIPTVGELFSEAFDAFFNLDSRIFRTIRDCWIPAYLTKAYFEGKHKRYLHPLRFFLIAAVVHFASLAYLINKTSRNELAGLQERMTELSIKSEFLSTLDSISHQLEEEQPGRSYIVPFDSVAGRFREKQGQSNLPVSSLFALRDSLGKDVNIPLTELMTNDAATIIRKYGINGFVWEVLVEQQIRFFQNNRGFVQFILGNLIWMVFLMVPVVSGILFLLYWRQGRYFIEHLIFSYHLHAVSFLLVTPFLIGHEYLEGTAILVLAALVYIYLILSFRFFYHQNWIKTLFKVVIFGMSYLVMLLLFSLLTVIIAFFLF